MQSRLIPSFLAAIALAAIPTSGAVASQDLRSPDARDAASAALRDASTYSAPRDLRSPDARDAARGVTRVTFAPAPVQTSASDSGWFDWTSAALGAGVLALLLIGAAGVTNGRRHLRGHVAT